MEQIEQIKNVLNNSKNIVVITGAGISTPSGIPDIRSNNGAMNDVNLLKKYKYSYETIVSHDFFFSHTKEFYRYYKEVMVHKDAKPNKAHYYLKELEKNHNVTIITQNIDGLHTLAGSSKVIEFHGSVYKNHCLNCHEEYPLSYILESNDVPRCNKCHGLIKPDVVLFNESIDENDIYASLEALHNADTLLVIGSSLNVYPASALIYEFKGEHTILINKDETPLDNFFNFLIHDDIIKVINELNK